MPTPILINEKTLRLYFSSRDNNNNSHIFYVDVVPKPPWDIIEISKSPILSPGAIGTFDANGVMPTAIVNKGNELWMYYIGWTQRLDVPYHNSIGVVRSFNQGKSFERFLAGPVIGTNVREPYFCGTGEILKVDDNWIMYYMSATDWKIINNHPEPRYHLKQAFSEDGILWDYGEKVTVDYTSKKEGGIARATILKDNNGYWMWYCYRGINDYRGKGKQAYRIGISWSENAKEWNRLSKQKIFSNNSISTDFDYYMQCYPKVIEVASGTYLFYNGSDFGQTGIGYASLINPKSN
jgi:predicted GH43/DUF377 family glycosyl hydrolase